MTGAASKGSNDTDRPSLLLPSGATLSVVAALIDSFGDPALTAKAFALLGALSTVGAWMLVTGKRSGAPSYLGVRFFSILAIALAISGLLIGMQAGWLGSVGVIGLWVASAGAGIEWLRGRTLRIGTTN